jgi:D-alanine-D-alanine ligase
MEAATAREVSDTELASFSPMSLLECVQSDALSGIDIAFIMLHGKHGEDGAIQQLLELRGIRYTGSNVLASGMAMDKTVTKILLQVANIPTPHWVTLNREQILDPEVLSETQRELRGPVVVKPNDQGSTVGMTIVENGSIDDLAAAVQLAAQFSDQILIERYIAGRELTVAVLGGDALPVIEIVPKDGYYDYSNKYTKGRTEYFCPADLSEDVRDYVHNLAVSAHTVLGCKAWSRVDFRLSDENVPFCLEVNTVPGFTETSLVPMAARAAGIEFADLCEEIINLSA